MVALFNTYQVPISPSLHLSLFVCVCVCYPTNLCAWLHASFGPIGHMRWVEYVFLYRFWMIFCPCLIFILFPFRVPIFIPHGICILIHSVPLPLCLWIFYSAEHWSAHDVVSCVMVCTWCSQYLSIIVLVALAYYKSRQKIDKSDMTDLPGKQHRNLREFTIL